MDIIAELSYYFNKC